MKILVTGSSGFIGSFIVPALRSSGAEVVRLARRKPSGPDEVFWDTASGRLDESACAGADAVVHLAGENLFGAWTPAKKAAIRDSRVAGTRRLVEAMSRMKSPPRVLLSGSAEGFYGHRGDEVLVEESSPGEGFLAGVCRDWEAAAMSAAEFGTRVATMRLGAVLHPAGGALGLMRPWFRRGLGGRLGDGRQWMSWIAMDDVVAAVRFLLETPSLSGAFNLSTPNPVTNREFTQYLARVLHRPALLPIPRAMLRIAVGGMVDEVLFAGMRMHPKRLLDAGFPFAHPTLESTLMEWRRAGLL